MNCKFEDTFNDVLQDELLCGMCNTSTQKRLLAEADLTFIRALELAQGMEAAKNNSEGCERYQSCC